MIILSDIEVKVSLSDPYIAYSIWKKTCTVNHKSWGTKKWAWGKIGVPMVRVPHVMVVPAVWQLLS